MKIFVIVLSVFLIIPEIVFGLPTTHDPISYKNAIEILKESKKQVEKIKEAVEEAKETKQRIGDIKEKANTLRKELGDWRTYYDKIDTLDSEDFSILSVLGLDRYTPSRNGINGPKETFNLLNNKIFMANARPATRNEYTNTTSHMVHEREKISRNSLITGIIVAEKNKNNLKDSKNKIFSITQKSANSQDLADLMQAQNEMLAIVATELVMQRELQAQMLEFMTTHASNQYGTGKNEVPENYEYKFK